MKWTALWSLMLTGVMITGCGGDSGNKSSGNDSIDPTLINHVGSDSCAPLSGYFSQLLTKTNNERARLGRVPLRLSLQLGKSAQDYAEEMANNNFFGHGATNSFITRIRATGYTGTLIGENLAAGGRNPTEAFDLWNGSTSHRDNFLNPEFTEVGFGLYDATNKSLYGQYWVQHLGSGNSQGGTYVPINCGLDTTQATGNAAPNTAVAGRANLSIEPSADAKEALPDSVHRQETLSLPGNGNIPVGSLAFAVAGAVSGDGNREIPEPALALGLAGLGLALWRDRKAAAGKTAKRADNQNL